MNEPKWKQELRGAAGEMERELGRAVAYVNDRIVPNVRREGRAALGALAAEMRRLADRLEGRSDDTHPGQAQGQSRP